MDHRWVLFVAGLAACGKGGGGGGGQAADGVTIATKTRTVPLDPLAYEVTGTLPDWAQGEGQYGHGRGELYVEAPTRDTLASIVFRGWHRYASSGTPAEDAKPMAANALKKPTIGGLPITAGSKLHLVEDTFEIAPGAWAFAVAWSDPAHDDDPLGVYAEVAVAQAGAGDAASPMHGFTCEITLVHKLPKDPDYLSRWKELAQLCAAGKLAKVKR